MSRRLIVIRSQNAQPSKHSSSWGDLISDRVFAVDIRQECDGNAHAKLKALLMIISASAARATRRAA